MVGAEVMILDYALKDNKPNLIGKTGMISDLLYLGGVGTMVWVFFPDEPNMENDRPFQTSDIQSLSWVFWDDELLPIS